jgi:ankyrin repeat protein
VDVNAADKEVRPQASRCGMTVFHTENQLGPQGNVSLHLAAKAGFVPTVQVLLQLGARPDIANKEGKKPLDVALDNATKNLLKR